MRAKVQLVSLVALTVAGLMSLAACGGGSNGNGGGGGGGGNPTPSSNGLTIYPSIASVPVGGTADFTGYVPSDSSATITWAVSGSSNGSITGSGVYTAPTSVPTPAAVAITATSGNFSATAVVTVTAAQGIAVSPAAASVPAGSVTPFTATSNGAIAAGVTWEVNGTAGGDGVHGTIDANGNYTAPLTPPPGGSTVVTATVGGNAGTSTVTVVFSSLSLSGPYSFSYSGADSTTGFLLVTGNFTASPVAGTDGGTITGLEDAIDASSLQAGEQITGTFTVGPDGRGTMTISTGETWQFCLASTEHALLINFNTGVASGSGTIDQLFTTKTPLANGLRYVFQVSGLDSGLNPVGIAGAFGSLGSNALAPNTNVLDMNDSATPNGTTTTDDTTLTGSYSLNPGNLTGTLTLTSTDLGVLTTGTAATTSIIFDMYVASDNHIRIIETDGLASLAGDIFLAPAPGGAGYTAALLQTGNYAFTMGGATGSGPYAAGGVLISNGGGTSPTSTSGSITGGVFDNNNGGDGLTSQSDATITSSGYEVDATTGRISSTTVTSKGTSNWVGYVTAPIPVDPASPGSATQVQVLLLETDANVIAGGSAYLQSTTSEPSGSYALNLTGQATGANGGEQDVLAQLGINGTTITGSMDINNFATNTTIVGLNVASSKSTIVSTDANGRGTATFTAANGASFPVAFYVVDQNTALMIETDNARVMTGLLMKQY
jgi:hypothetical protein